MLLFHSLPKFVRHLIIPVILGALFPLAFKPLALWPIAMLSAACLYALATIYKESHYRIAFFYGFGFFLSGVYWVYSAMMMVKSPPVIALLITIVFCASLALLFVLQLWVFRRFFVTRQLTAVSFAAIWFLFEWLRTWLFTGFPWLLTGLSLSDAFFGQWAAVIGVYGLSFFMILISCLLVDSLRFDWKYKLATSTVITGLILGALWIQQQPFGQAVGSINIASLQTAIDQKTKWDADQVDTITERTLSMTQSVQGADLILWAESAITDGALATLTIIDEVDQWAQQNDQAVLAAIARADYEHQAYFNSMLGLGNADGIYNKQRLVPFGEYLPFESILRKALFFMQLPPSNFKAGDYQQAGISLNHVQFDQPIAIASLVCYEAAYSHLVRRLSKDKQLIITATNDDWFGGSIASDQHLQIAQMRAIENRLSTVRATQSGHTVFIDSYGQIIKALPQFSMGILQGDVELRDSLTPYQRFGGLYQIWLALLFLVTLMFFVKPKKSTN